jgi:type II secretory pathway predicted ATPase ExeA
MVVVIDALDECDREDDVRLILRLLPQVQKSESIRLRFLLTSRPELPIRLELNSITDDHQELVLHEISEPVIEHDIALYLETKFSQLKRERSLPSDWPGEERIKVLVDRMVSGRISFIGFCI